ncbi:Cytochrome P450 [Corchorus olitorius]|uniref:Cytochrome P450 n=1 Tax=Corchorus olitorius TaxID=93759 RepID=A0A1R3HK78_9ROSI|nr:Cytochrome P450 [Corchorus olitorius]
MKSLFLELVMNVMMRMIAGKRYYREGDGEILEEERKFKEIVKVAFELSGVTNIVDFVPVLKWVGLNKIEKKLTILQRKRDDFVQNLIKQPRKSIGDPLSEGKSKTMVDVIYLCKTLIQNITRMISSKA